MPRKAPRQTTFCPPSIPYRRSRTPSVVQAVCCRHSGPRQTRREILHATFPVAGALAAAVATAGLKSSPVRAAERLSKLEKAVVPVVMCRTIMSPVKRYISEGAWDKGRTNVNYCTRVLALRSRMRDAAEQLEGDDFYEAMEIMGEMSNTMTQLDASLYTPLFIPADEGISVEQRKYQTQAFAFYEDAVGYLDSFLGKVPGASLEKARTAAAAEKYEIRMEVE